MHVRNEIWDAAFCTGYAHSLGASDLDLSSWIRSVVFCSWSVWWFGVLSLWHSFCSFLMSVYVQHTSDASYDQYQHWRKMRSINISAYYLRSTESTIRFVPTTVWRFPMKPRIYIYININIYVNIGVLIQFVWKLSNVLACSHMATNRFCHQSSRSKARARESNYPFWFLSLVTPRGSSGAFSINQ